MRDAGALRPPVPLRFGGLGERSPLLVDPPADRLRELGVFPVLAVAAAVDGRVLALAASRARPQTTSFPFSSNTLVPRVERPLTGISLAVALTAALLLRSTAMLSFWATTQAAATRPL